MKHPPFHGWYAHRPVLRMRPSTKQQGASLVISLLMLVAIMMLGMSTAGMAIQGEKGARADRDRQVAWHAAETALIDAELDIDGSPDPVRSRSAIFSQDKAIGFPDTGKENCHTIASPYFGLCHKAISPAMPTWLEVDFLDTGARAGSVPYGTFTGRSLQTGNGALPNRLPRYVIELIASKPAVSPKADVRYLYRVTAVGFGVRETTQVMLQTFYRKAAAGALAGEDKSALPGGRLSWREVGNWQELRHDALLK